ncbi:gamma-glutamylcyclotransferase family protein [Martelella lutilitoris]|nr:gamma-glutamylcyclotransferase family protein [Martelella lutilitoris]
MPEGRIYFAYGSNMLGERLLRRCPSARALGPAVLEDHALDFAKPGRDGSGKATIWATPGARVFGVLFSLEPGDCDLLDGFEGRGKGYDRVEDCVVRPMAGGAPVTAFTYMAPPAFRASGLLPFDWYHALIIAGARQNGLPEEYIARLEGIAALADPQAGRAARCEALDILSSQATEACLQARPRTP